MYAQCVHSVAYKLHHPSCSGQGSTSCHTHRSWPLLHRQPNSLFRLQQQCEWSFSWRGNFQSQYIRASSSTTLQVEVAERAYSLITHQSLKEVQCIFKSLENIFQSQYIRASSSTTLQVEVVEPYTLMLNIWISP